MPNRKQIRRRRITAATLIGLCIVALTVYFGETSSGALHTMQRGAMDVLSPIQSLASGAIKPARDAVNWVGDSIDAKSENERLKQQLKDARIRQARLQGEAEENEKLRELTDFKDSDAFPAGRTPVTTRVIVRSPTAWYGRVTINKGRSSGIRVNQPVIAEGALVGKVTTVARGSAQVTLLTDSRSGVGAKVSGKNILGVVRTGSGGEAGASDLRLDYIRQRGSIRVGELVVTSGTVTEPSDVDSLFPPGIPIGEVSKVDSEERRLYGRVHIKPFADMQDISVVQVLTKRRSR